MRIMRIRAVWATNLAALLYGFGLFAMFITVPQYVQTPTSAGYGFGASVTQSGLYLLPFALAMVVVAPFTGWLSLRIGSKVVLIIGSLISACFLRRPGGRPQPVLGHLRGGGPARGRAWPRPSPRWPT